MRDTPAGAHLIKQGTYFYNQTVGLTFVWTLENVLMAGLVYALALAVDAALGADVLIARWAAVVSLGCAIFTGGCNAVTAFLERNLEVYSRHYMMATQAYCGIVSCIGSVYSAVAWKCYFSAAWRSLFVQSDAVFVGPILAVPMVANNVLWVLSLVLTYSCTPFGAGNSAFLKVPVAASLAIFAVLLNELANNGLLLCHGQHWTVFTFIMCNAYIVSSFILHVLSAVEFDCFHVLPASFHSTPTTRVQYDVWVLLHGLVLVGLLVAYGIIAPLTRFTFFGIVVVLVFVCFVTVIEGVDLYRVFSHLLHTDEVDEERVHEAEVVLAKHFVSAADKHRHRGLRHLHAESGLRRRRRAMFAERGHEAHVEHELGRWAADTSKEMPLGEDAPRSEAGSWGEREPWAVSDTDSESPHADVHSPRRRRRANSFDSIDLHTAHVRAHGAQFALPEEPVVRPTALSMFPNIPVSLRRTGR